MKKEIGIFTEQECKLLLKALDLLSSAEQRLNADYEWGTAEKSCSNNKLRKIYHLKQTAEFGNEDKDLLLSALSVLSEHELRRNNSLEWGSGEKTASNKVLQSIHTLQERIETSEAFGTLSPLAARIKNATVRANLQTPVQPQGNIFAR